MQDDKVKYTSAKTVGVKYLVKELPLTINLRHLKPASFSTST